MHVVTYTREDALRDVRLLGLTNSPEDLFFKLSGIVCLFQYLDIYKKIKNTRRTALSSMTTIVNN